METWVNGTRNCFEIISANAIDCLREEVVHDLQISIKPEPVTNHVRVGKQISNMFFVLGTLSSVGSASAALDLTTPLNFVPITPCRIADTRTAAGAFGGPSIAGQSSRNFVVPNSSCGIPTNAQAYSLNVAVVPQGALGYLTVWPAGQTQPLVSTLNSDGRIKSNAAIVPAGTNGAISVFASNPTDIVLDIGGYFVSATNTSALAFYPIAPCRIADTRLANGSLAGPYLTGQIPRTFPIQSSSCGLPASAQAYSLNFAAVPHGQLGYLTAWPTGQPQPLVASLNAPTGAITSNAAIIPAGTAGSVDIFASNDTDLIIDVNGYFAPAGTGGLSMYNLQPCRVLDSRNPSGAQPFSGAMNVNIGASACAPSASAQAYVLNATVVPPAALGYLTLWPQGSTQPLVSTLNSPDAAITGNMAILPSTSGSISVFASNPTYLVLDISANFAPPPSTLSFPVISDFSPKSGPAGTLVTLTGTNLGTPQVTMPQTGGGSLAVPLSSSSATSITFVIPFGAATGNLTVTNSIGSATSAVPFTVTPSLPTPFITSITPATGKNGATVSVTVAGLNLANASFALTSVDPTNTHTGAVITLVSNTGTQAILTLVLGGVEGQYALVGTNTAGAGSIAPGSLFTIGPVNGLASFYLSVLNTGFNPATNPALPTSHNVVSTSVSVLDISFDPNLHPPFPTSKNTISFDAAVLNTNFNPALNPPLPTKENSAGVSAAVLNVGSGGGNSPLRAGQNTSSSYVSVCNVSKGCAASAPSVISASASHTVREPRSPLPNQPPSPNQFAAKGLVPELDTFDPATTVAAGQTVRLTARNVEPGATLEFRVDNATIATLSEAPYETLFTVPDGKTEIFFQLAVSAPGQTESLSAITRIAVVPDTGAAIEGSTGVGGGLELSLAAGGLRTEFFQLLQPVAARPSLDGLQPVRAGYATAINEPNPGAIFGDDPLGAHLATDYAVRFSGQVRAEIAGQYRFWLTARSGAAFWIDGELLMDSGMVTGDPGAASVSVTLASGWHAIKVIYYLAVGPASVRLEWQSPNAPRREVVGPLFLRTPLEGVTTVAASDGTFAFPQVPKKFDSVWIRAKRGEELLEFPAVKAGSHAVSLAVPK